MANSPGLVHYRWYDLDDIFIPRRSLTTVTTIIRESNLMKQNWFYRKSSIKKLWIGAIALLSSTVVLEVFIKLHPHFKIEELFGFHSVYGFLVCVGMIIFAKGLGYLIKRKDTYYDD